MDFKNVTIQDIAETAKVSKSTVSRVINNSTPVADKKRKAVLDAMEKLNFQPNIFARGLAGGQSMTIGIVTQNIGSPFYDSVAQGIISGLRSSIYAPVFVDGQWKAEVEEQEGAEAPRRHAPPARARLDTPLKTKARLQKRGAGGHRHKHKQQPTQNSSHLVRSSRRHRSPTRVGVREALLLRQYRVVHLWKPWWQMPCM